MDSKHRQSRKKSTINKSNRLRWNVLIPPINSVMSLSVTNFPSKIWIEMTSRMDSCFPVFPRYMNWTKSVTIPS